MFLKTCHAGCMFENMGVFRGQKGKKYNWIALLVKTRKNKFLAKPKGLRQIRDYIRKTLDKENSNLPCIYLYDLFLVSFLKNDFPNIFQAKIRNSFTTFSQLMTKDGALE